MMVEGLFVVTLWAQDVAATAHWYRDVLELELLPHHGSRPHFRLGDTLLTIMQCETPITQAGQKARFPNVVFRMKDLDAAVLQLQEHRVALPWASKKMPITAG